MIERLGFIGSEFRSGVRPLFRGLAIAASGLSAQRRRIETAAENIANAETTRTPDGGPYRRKVVELAPKPFEEVQVAVAGRAPRIAPPGPREAGGVEVVGIAEDPTEGPLVYDPGHPDADEAGYVRYPNVRQTDELITLMEARRAYEANATVFQAVKSMLRRALEI
ncbi:MAG TPA: flagellar basal body rod protein FlgC [Longimicrobiales bacterium]|nr:flagellar basal body rod protein FlgC [Longimicrobiales bacterium]